VSELRNEALELAGLLDALCKGKPSDAQVGLLEADGQRIKSCLTELARSAPQRRSKPPKRKGLTSRSKLSKRTDHAYLTHVRRHPCCACSATRNVEAHHWGRRGLGQKAADRDAVPLCSECHHSWHQHGRLATVGLSRDASIELFQKTAYVLQQQWAELHDGNGF